MIGEMTHRITLERPRRISNGRGGWTIDYKAGDRMEVWAAAETLSIGQQLRYQEHQETATIRFVVRENPFIDTDTRILFNGAVFSITEMGPTEKRFLEIRAREV